MGKFVERNCLHCNLVFKAELRYLKRGHAKFCGRSCSRKYAAEKSAPEPNVKCAYCSKPFYKNKTKQRNSKSGLFFCCREHKDIAQRIGGIKEIHLPHYNDGNSHYRKVAIRIKGERCERCGYDDHSAAIVVHHKDHNRSNNDISNLEVLCANCHAIEHWGGAGRDQTDDL